LATLAVHVATAVVYERVAGVDPVIFGQLVCPKAEKVASLLFGRTAPVAEIAVAVVVVAVGEMGIGSPGVGRLEVMVPVRWIGGPSSGESVSSL
jgi:hypothetical protein